MPACLENGNCIVYEYSSVLAETICQTPAFLTGHKITERSKNTEFKAGKKCDTTGN